MRQSTTYNKLIGRIDTEYYFLNDIFSYEDGLKGATGTIVVPLTEEEYQEQVDYYFEEDNMRDFWQDAVKSGRTEMSLTNWIDYVRENDGEETAFDNSGEEYALPELQAILKTPVYATNCSGGGRCFSADMKFDEVYNEKLWAEIKQAEIENIKE